MFDGLRKRWAEQRRHERLMAAVVASTVATATVKVASSKNRAVRPHDLFPDLAPPPPDRETLLRKIRMIFGAPPEDSPHGSA